MTEPQQDTLVVHIELDSRINFASQQNDVPVVKVLHVENLMDEAIYGIQVNISAEGDVRNAIVPCRSKARPPSANPQRPTRYRGSYRTPLKSRDRSQVRPKSGLKDRV